MPTLETPILLNRAQVADHLREVARSTVYDAFRKGRVPADAWDENGFPLVAASRLDEIAKVILGKQPEVVA